MKAINELEKRIKELQIQLKEAQQNTYIYDTNHLQCSNGELHIGFGDDKWLVWNINSLYQDLPFIINQVKKENDKQQKMYAEQIKESLKEF